MTDEQRRVRSDSDRLLEAAADLRRLEQEKRSHPISSPSFHRLADEVQRRARRVYQLADEEAQDGDRAETTGATIDDVRPTDDRSA